MSDSDEIWNEISKTYNLPLNNLLVNKDFDIYAVKNGDTVLYGQIVPNVSDGKKVFVFSYDSLVTENLLDLSKALPFITYESPALEFDLKEDLDSIVSKIKSKKTYLKGKRSSCIDTKVFEPNSSKLKDIIEKKRLTYPLANLAYENFLLANGYKLYVMEGFHESSLAWEMIFCVNDQTKDVCGTTIVLTDCKTIRKLSPYILGHYYLVVWAKTKKFNRVRFSAFFQYKKIFGQNPVMYPTVKVSDVKEENGFIKLNIVEI